MKTTSMVGNCKQKVINNTKRIITTAKRTHKTFFSFSDFSFGSSLFQLISDFSTLKTVTPTS